MRDNQCTLRQAKAGDPDAMAEIYRQYRDPLMAFATRQCHDIDAAEDVLQDVFVAYG